MNPEHVNKRLEAISAIIPFDTLLSRDAEDMANIARYYRLNRLTYTLMYSRQGFVHMGISRDGQFKDADFLEQAKIISEFIEANSSSDVLELAAGKAATTKYLADKHKDLNFTGLDLPDGQLNIRSSGHPNLQLLEGDYHDLSQFESDSFDLVYIIEALCHARSKAKVLEEIGRILKREGALIIFDGYVSKQDSAMSETERLISELIYSSMMVTKNGHLYDDLRQTIKMSGFEISKEEDLSEYVLPSMRRLEAYATSYFKHPVLARLANKIIPSEITSNIAAAYLLPISVSEGLHQYWLTIATKDRI